MHSNESQQSAANDAAAVSAADEPVSEVPAVSKRAANRAALLEDVEWMASTGETMPGAAARLHVHPESLRNRLAYAGRADLWAALLANGDPTWIGYTGPRGTIRRQTSSTHRPTSGPTSGRAA